MGTNIQTKQAWSWVGHGREWGGAPCSRALEFTEFTQLSLGPGLPGDHRNHQALSQG